MDTKFGPQAKEGDYVIVLDSDYVHRRATNYIAKVYKDKAYTGRKMVGNKKYIHKMYAEIVIPEAIVPEETKRLIEEDIQLHINKTKQNKKESRVCENSTDCRF